MQQERGTLWAWSRIVLVLLLVGVVAACAGEGTPAETGEEPAQPEATEVPVEETEAPEEPAEATEAPEEPAEEGRWQEPIVIGWTPPDITGVFKTATDFFEQAAEEANAQGFNVEVISQSPATHTAFADQVGIIEDYIQREVDVIVISPVEVEVVKPAIQQANEAGIPVIIVNLLEPIEDVQVESYIGFDNTEAAEVSAYATLDYFGGPGVLGEGEQVDVSPDTYLDLEWWTDLYGDLSEDERAQIEATGEIIEGIAGGFFSTARLRGYHNVIDQYPNVTIAGEPCAADWNREKGISCTEDILQRHPDGGLDFIWAASNEMGLGAMLALESAERLETADGGPTLDDMNVAVFTNDVTPESVSRIGEGRMIAETHHGFAEWGWFGTEFAVKVACGIDVPQTQDIRPRTVYEGNADQFYPDPVLPEIDWESIKEDCQ